MSKVLMDYFGNTNNKFLKGYCFSNESLVSCFKNFDLKGKSVLTVGSSGDQAIASAESGSTDITIVDICPLAEYIYTLKITAKQVLSEDELKEYFSIKGLSKNIYDKFKFSLPIHIRSFYDYLYSASNGCFSNAAVHVDSIFQEIWNIEFLRKKIHFFTNQNLKIMDISPKFIVSDIREFESDKKYDFIYLSNLLSNLTMSNNAMIDKLSPMLNDEGKIMLKYFWYGVNTQDDIYVKFHDEVTDELNSILVYTKEKRH